MVEEQATARGFEAPGPVRIIVEPGGVGAAGGTRGRLKVEPDQLKLSKSGKHKATWDIEGGSQFTIEFQDKSPFERKKYDEKTAKSLSLREDAEDGTYKYTVTVPNCDPLDPEVIVGS